MDEADAPLYEHSRAPTERRVADLLERMTVGEKAGQMAGILLSRIQSQRWERTTIGDIQAAIKHHDVGSVTPFASAFSTHNSPAVVPRLANRLQRVAREETRLGIPLFVPVDAVHGHANIKGATVFPHNLGMAATWDPALVRRVAEVTATEMVATGANANFAPNAGVVRDFRWGRSYETYGESSHLVGEMVAAAVDGLYDPARDDAVPVATAVKHFPTDSSPARGEDGAPVEVSRKTMSRVHLPPFERAIDNGAPVVLLSPNAVNGEPVHGSARYIGDVLRDRLGFEGVVASWHGGVDLHKYHRTAVTREDAIAQAVEAGLDIAFVEGPEYARTIEALVERDRLSERRVDESVRRILALKFRLGLFDDPYLEPTRSRNAIGTEEHRRLARDAARESVVLLENDADVLPLDGDVGEVLVTGPNADSLNNLCGGRTIGNIDRSRGTTVLTGIQRRVDDDTTVTHSPGTSVRERINVRAVVDAAEAADVAVVVVGENWYIHEFGPTQMTGPTGEFPSRTGLSLPDVQRELCERVGRTDTPTVLVTVAGRPLTIAGETSVADATVFAFYPGYEGGAAIADVLFGNTNPSGALPVTVPNTVGEIPTTHDWYPHPKPLGEDEHPPSYDPLFEFGHGLTYSDMRYDSVDVSPESATSNQSVTVTVGVENRSDRDGTEVVQLYLRDLFSSCLTPERELKGFARLAVPAGETGECRFTLSPADLAAVGPDGSRTVEPGVFEVEVGGLSAEFEVFEPR